MRRNTSKSENNVSNDTDKKSKKSNNSNDSNHSRSSPYVNVGITEFGAGWWYLAFPTRC